MFFLPVVVALLAAPAVEPPTTPEAPENREELVVLDPAEQDVPKAKRLFAAGKQAAARNRWAEAIRYFAEAYRYSGSAGQLYSMGRGHRELYFHRGRDPVQLRLALLRLQQYLDRSPTGRNRDNARRFIAELQPYANVLEGFDDEPPLTRLMVYSPVDDATVSIDGGEARPAPVTVDVDPGPHRIAVGAEGYHRVARAVDVPLGATVPLEVPLAPRPAALQIEGPEGAALYIDGERRGALPLPGAVELPAGPHQVAVSDSGRTPAIRELSLRRGETRRLAVDLPVTVQRKAAYATIAIGSASVLASAILTGLSLRSQSRAQSIEDQRQRDGISMSLYDEQQRAWDQRDGRRTAAVVTGVVGFSAVATGVVLWLTDRPQLGDRLFAPERAAVSVGFTAGRGFAAAGVRGHLPR
ncbi:MAG: PEGA domain-containing protein [Myxococcota bacterium]